VLRPAPVPDRSIIVAVSVKIIALPYIQCNQRNTAQFYVFEVTGLWKADSGPLLLGQFVISRRDKERKYESLIWVTFQSSGVTLVKTVMCLLLGWDETVSWYSIRR
jgi:hypothetical protein